MGGGIYALLEISIVVRISEVTTVVSSSHNMEIDSRINFISSRTKQVMLVSGNDRLSVSFVTYLGTPDSNALSLCPMVIKPRLTSHLVTFQ
jgi:c-di-GMP-binding flagellar brake protein YcgR